MSGACRSGTFCFLLACTWLSGCSTHHAAAQPSVSRAQSPHSTLDSSAPRLQPAVRAQAGYFIQHRPVPLQSSITWLQRPIEIHAEQLPLDTLLTHLLNDESLGLELDDSVEPKQLITLHYQGSLAGALRQLRSITHYAIHATAHTLHVSAFDTRSFDIAYLSNTVNFHLEPAQPLLTLWQDLENTLDQLKSPQGKITVSESTTSVTVTDHPVNLRAIARYIQRLNQRLTQQVAIKIQVIEVQLNPDSSYGLNWNSVAKTLGDSWSLRGRTADAHSLIATPINGFNNDLGQIGFARGNTTPLLNALNQQGKVRVITEPEVTTLNNQTAVIRLTHQTGYIKRVSHTESRFSNTSNITPGSVMDGFTLSITPKIQADQVLLQMASTMANLDKLEKVSTEPTEHTQPDSAPGQFQAIQVPSVSQKSFNQQSLVPTGATLIVAGFQQATDPSHRELLVLITPVILVSHNSHDRYYAQ